MASSSEKFSVANSQPGTEHLTTTMILSLAW